MYLYHNKKTANAAALAVFLKKVFMKLFAYELA